MPSLTSCTDHPKRPAVGTCPACGKPYCERCMSYRGSKYVCKKCAPTVPAEQTMVMDPYAGQGKGLKAEAAEEQEKKEKQKSKASKYKRSRYSNNIALRQAVKKLMIVFALLLLAAIAYLPFLSKLAVDDAFEGGYIPAEYAPRLVIWSGRIQILYGREEGAIDFFNESLEKLEPEDQALVYFYLGEAFLKMVDLDLASKNYGIFLRRWPTHDLALEAGNRLEEIREAQNMKKLNQKE